MWRLSRLIQRALGAYLPPRGGQREFYLTFDDGPSPNTAVLIDLLGAWDGCASFFWTWSRYKENITTPVVPLLWKNGHNVGIHGMTHLSGWRVKRTAREITRAIALWKKVGVPLIPAFRAPYGHWGFSPLPEKIKLVFWDLMPPDYLRHKKWLHQLLAQLRSGDIVVLHEHAHNKPFWYDFFKSVVADGWQMKALPLEVQA
ncbi:MAG: polysaccharide deacetylase family protein [Bacteroidia bacterium]|nr:polysaccharide deacetylase family protein [Bacteroidia bacterium]MCX7651492.1 polysaccharide deacetylase family protein [Bacteroidia bacterium]MDW8416753.1 polysaccharide deacetylase family protein [Bacteroidia bacterium]